MTLNIVDDARSKPFEFETCALVHPSGFREYDARWWFGHPGSPVAPELNLIGVQALGMGLATLIGRRGIGPEIVTVNGVRVVAEDGTWGLVCASSNKPELVVVVESPVSSKRRRSPEVGAYNQTF